MNNPATETVDRLKREDVATRDDFNPAFIALSLSFIPTVARSQTTFYRHGIGETLCNTNIDTRLIRLQ